MNSIRKSKAFMAILYVLVFLLLAEWLTPVITLTDTGHKTLFLVFIGISLAMAYFQVHWGISALVKTFYIMWFLILGYTDTTFFSFEALGFILADLRVNLEALFAQDWADTTDIFRTVLFFSLLWMAVYLIHYWVSFRLSIFLFYILTVVFIAVLDTFSPYNGDTAIIRIMVIGLMLAGLLHLARWLESHRINETINRLAAYTIPLFLMVAVSTALALYLPKAGPVWPDPVPYITSFSGEGGPGPASIGRIGYGVDDSELGGSFMADNTLAFRAEVEDGQYWKVETKDTYTTKGWELSEPVAEPVLYNNGDLIETEFQPGSEEESVNAVLEMELEFPFVLYPYGIETIQMEEEIRYSYTPIDQKIEPMLNGAPYEPDAVELQFNEPAYSLTGLRETTIDKLAELPPEFDRYKQLPEELPQRVRDLAAEITADSETVYDKARAVENYFERDGFEYSLTDIPVPEEDQDYVDQFLFETKRGYCDNFSTSMVVMLRSLDIPARWVKGFNEGEQLEDENGIETDVYQITNNNAHSWVEAYMPDVGWMLFEPTIGFTGSSQIDFDLDIETSDSEEPETPERPQQPELEEEDEAAAAAEARGPGMWERLGEYVADNRGAVLFGMVASILAAVLLFVKRQKWLPKVLVPYYRRRKGEQTFEKAYLRLLKQLDLYGIKREDGQTLMSYARYIDSFFGTKEMTRLTASYEQSVYGGQPETVEWSELKESWENLINRTSS
ncbi:transglutaminase TgpA family protein [Planococcus salinarum]|uniref:transglutaminase TgpA family protein n=1 Tax=Planococcus salinarum TaxID=622695 RepID=UPI000E3CC49A|nr:transglutaminase domain-containing protein [Planococcus salinarum]TAA69160.1 transglutaminase [Planococcus salinarum]